MNVDYFDKFKHTTLKHAHFATVLWCTFIIIK